MTSRLIKWVLLITLAGMVGHVVRRDTAAARDFSSPNEAMKTRRESMHDQTTILGAPVVDITSKSTTDLEKNESVISVSVGGPANVMRAYSLVANDAPTLVAITGDDDLCGVCAGMLEKEFGDVTMTKSASATRASVITRSPRGDRCDTVRPQVDCEAAFRGAEPAIHACDLLLMCSLSDGELPLVRRAADACGAEVYFIPTARQIKDRRALIEVTSKIEYLQLNHHELESMAGFKAEIPLLINALREASAFKKGVIVTAGSRGIYAFIDGFWYHSPALDVPVNRTVGAGDFAAGTILACLRTGAPLNDWDLILKYANAASAMHVANLPRLGGWNELLCFSNATPPLPVRYRSKFSTAAALNYAVCLARPVMPRMGWAAIGATVALLLTPHFTA
jgi:sugar/nucleoside kinase (ribokinase family)